MMYGTLISSVTVGAGGASSIDFTSIPQTYTDLILICSIRSTSAGDAFYKVRLNSDSASNYPFKRLDGNGSTVSTAGATLDGWYMGDINDPNDTSNVFTSGQLYIPNYTSSSTKSASSENTSENNGTAAQQSIRAYTWAGTSAVTSVSMTCGSGSFSQYSTAYLYGLLKGSGGATVS